MPRTASVAIYSALRQYDKLYTYAVPDELAGSVLPGIRVEIPFGRSNNTTEGIVTDISETGAAQTPPAGLKSITGVIDDVAFLDENMIDMAKWMKHRYLCTHYDAFRCMLPPGLPAGKRGAGKSEKAAFALVQAEALDEMIESGELKNIKHIRLLEFLCGEEYVTVGDLRSMFSVSPGMLETMRKRGWIDFFPVEKLRDPFESYEAVPTEPPEPTDEQRPVIEGLKADLKTGKFTEALLYGITGSGKTEVYMQLIRECIDSGRQAVVLVPEIALTPQMVANFRGRFGSAVAVFHSRLSMGERFDQWKLIRQGRVNVAVGARSAVFAPFSNLGVIIIDEEHEPSYKSENSPKYHAAEIAAYRAAQTGALLIYGSATPSVTSFYRAEKGEMKLYRMKARANNLELPKIFLVDMRDELKSGNRSIFSRTLAERLIATKKSGSQAILFLNKRGYASFVMCRSCGLVIKCRHCDVSMTYHAYDDRLICHYCGNTAKRPEVCPKCGSTYIRQFGTGTQKVEEELEKLGVGISSIRMDMDTTTGKHSHREILEKFRTEKTDVLVGTQMVAKGHDFPGVTLVGVLAADSMLNTGEYNSGERTFQLVTQVAGRAGRGSEAGKVVVQAYNTDHYCIQAALSHDYDKFYRQEIAIREAMQYPPFVKIATALISGKDDNMTESAAHEFAKELRDGLERGGIISTEAIGPARAPLSKIQGKYRWRVVIKFRDDRTVGTLERISNDFCRRRKSGTVDLNVDINPVNML